MILLIIYTYIYPSYIQIFINPLTFVKLLIVLISNAKIDFVECPEIIPLDLKDIEQLILPSHVYLYTHIQHRPADPGNYKQILQQVESIPDHLPRAFETLLDKQVYKVRRLDFDNLGVHRADLLQRVDTPLGYFQDVVVPELFPYV